MNINLHIIFDELNYPEKDIIASDSIAMQLNSIRILTSRTGQINHKYLYVVDDNSLECISTKIENIQLIYVGKKNISFFQEHNWEAIIIPEDIHKQDLLSEVMAIFEKYSDWYQDTLQEIASNSPIQDIFDLSAKYLKNPIALFDDSLIFLMKAGILPDDTVSQTWQEVLYYGYSLIDGFDHLGLAKKLREIREPFIIERNLPGNKKETQMTVSLFRNQEPFATFGSVEINHPFTLGQLSIISLVKNLMEIALINKKADINIADGVNYYVDRLLQGFSIDEGVVKFYLKNMRWKLDDDYLVMYFRYRDGLEIDKDLLPKYILRIKVIFPDSYVIPYENGILAILHDTCYPPDRIDDLQKFIEGIKLICGVSLAFSRYLNIKYAFIQAKSAILEMNLKDDRFVYYYADYYLEHIVSTLNMTTSTKSLCHPKILEMYSDNNDKDREFVHTLYMFLLNGRNITSTAKMLKIHRNTLIYRIDRIREVLQVDFDNCSSEILLLILISCIIVKTEYD